MGKIIGLRREDLSKIGEKRSSLSPAMAQHMKEAGHRLIVQPRKNPDTGEVKRAIYNKKYEDAGAEINEDISEAEIIFGLKEVDEDKILPGKAYFIFSHTHKGQKKNREMLKAFARKKCTLIDYELITDEEGWRKLTAFTYFAGYAGMIDSFWMLGKRLLISGHKNPFSELKQSKDYEDMHAARKGLEEAAEKIATKGTPKNLPPFIITFLGDGKTSIGAQKKFDILPHEQVNWKDLPLVFEKGDRKMIYKTVLEIPDMYRMRGNEGKFRKEFEMWERDKQRALYLKEPDRFESNLDRLLPFTVMLMNCILWAPRYQRTLSKSLLRKFWPHQTPLTAIGDITCDPEGSIEFSRETWIDDPVFIYDPQKDTYTMGFEGEGVAVLSIANLPCEFSSDASHAFSEDLMPLLDNILAADFQNGFSHSNLSDDLKRATILWKGKFTSAYKYMEDFLVP